MTRDGLSQQTRLRWLALPRDGHGPTLKALVRRCFIKVPQLIRNSSGTGNRTSD